ncbi:hypothetical protein ACJ6WF_49405 [Streptomyces sp. MMS24-I2-30]|uniref:hypothetical protein n=1 Tax=Streptomyces sp. MMS24-I2-30 TaxID=3351564 RepID=UPI003896DA67
MNKSKIRALPDRFTRRGVVLSVLGAITLGVAVLSVYVSYQILSPRFGGWSAPTVGALDVLWVVFQATQILAGNNRSRARRVGWAGLVLTAVNAAIPTADLILTGGFDLAVVLTPVMIVGTKAAWWIVLPSLGRKVSADTQLAIDTKRQQVADRLEEMEAEAAHRIELLRTARGLEERIAKAETAYRKSQLKMQQTMTEQLHGQAEDTQRTVSEKVLPASVAAIRLPELDTWTPTAPALPVTADRDGSGTHVPVLPAGRAASGTDSGGSHAGQGDAAAGRDGERHGGRDADRAAVTLAELAAVAGVPVPVPGEQLTGEQIGVVLRHLRYAGNPPASYRQARDSFRHAGYVGSEERIRHAWAALMANEGHGDVAEDAASEDETEDQDA